MASEATTSEVCDECPRCGDGYARRDGALRCRSCRLEAALCEETLSGQRCARLMFHTGSHRSRAGAVWEDGDAAALTPLERERDALAQRVRELEAERDAGAKRAEGWQRACEATAARWTRALEERDDARALCEQAMREGLAACERQRRSVEHTEYWYAVRLERLRDLAREHGCFEQHCAIVANGTASAAEPPTYAQQLNTTRWRAESVERDRARARAQLAAARAEGERLLKLWQLETGCHDAAQKELDALAGKARALLGALPTCGHEGCAALQTHAFHGFRFCDAHATESAHELPHAAALRALAAVVTESAGGEER